MRVKGNAKTLGCGECVLTAVYGKKGVGIELDHCGDMECIRDRFQGR